MTTSLNKQTKGTGWYIVPIPFLFGMVLDIFCLFVRKQSPESFAQTTCGLFHFNAVTQFLISHQLAEFVSAECLGTPKEPSLSIVLYMTKLSLSLITILGFVSTLLLVPKKYTGPRDRQFQRWRDLSKAKLFSQFLSQFALAVSVGIFALAVTGAQTPSEYAHHTFVYKLIEDCSVGVFTICSAGALQYAVWFVCYWFERKANEQY